MQEKALPQHRKLYELLRKHILNGVYPTDSLLPSENELCTLHHVTRPTVRQALYRLVSDGYIKKHQGKGSIVRELPKGIGILSIQGTTTGIGPHNLETKLFGKPILMNWPEIFSFELKNDEREMGCIQLERQRIVDGNPVLYEISYLPNINLPRFIQKSFENKSLFEVLRASYQIEVLGGNQRIWAMKATEKISNYLNIDEGAAILCLQRTLETNRVDFRFFSEIYCNTSEFYLEGSF
jgi:GntR family transcriptional regulator/GntR family frlABCD operon transcriptional regulator